MASNQPDAVASQHQQRDDIVEALNNIQDVDLEVELMSDLDHVLDDFPPSSEFLLTRQDVDTTTDESKNGNDHDEEESDDDSEEEEENEGEDGGDRDYKHVFENAPEICDVNEQQLDTEMAQALNALTLQDRNTALYDIHGVGDSIPETLEMIQQSLAQLEDYIERGKKRFAKKATAYCLAESQSPDFVNNESFRIQFLRFKDWNAKDASLVLFHHFSVKRELFGDDKLTQQITFQVLDEDDFLCLKNGHMQILPVCDPVGRYVLVSMLPFSKFNSVSSFVRVMWYMAMCIVDASSPEMHAKGIVAIMYNVKPQRQNKIRRSMPLTIRRARMALPFKVSSLHLCADAGIFGGSLFVDWLRVYFMETALKVRTRVHRGSHQECMDALAKFGIPREIMPLTADGTSLKRDRHKGWLESRKLLEEAQQLDNATTTYSILAPMQADVLLGRGRLSQIHIGNLRLRILLEGNMDRFNTKSSRGDKLSLAKEMVQTISATGGRFLKLEVGKWTIVTEDEACQKVAHDFRTLRKKIASENKQCDVKQEQAMEEHPAGKRARSSA